MRRVYVYIREHPSELTSSGTRLCKTSSSTQTDQSRAETFCLSAYPCRVCKREASLRDASPCHRVTGSPGRRLTDQGLDPPFRSTRRNRVLVRPEMQRASPLGNPGNRFREERRRFLERSASGYVHPLYREPGGETKKHSLKTLPFHRKPRGYRKHAASLRSADTDQSACQF